MSPEMVVTIICSLAGSSVLVTIMNRIFMKVDKRKALDEEKEKTEQSYKELKDKVDALTETVDKLEARIEALQTGSIVSLEDRIHFLVCEYLQQGFVYREDFDRLERMWNVYHNVLGGNGFLDNIMADLRKLPKKIK